MRSYSIAFDIILAALLVASEQISATDSIPNVFAIPVNVSVPVPHQYELLRDDEVEILQNGRLGLFLFTRYCGPGARIWEKIFKNSNTGRTYQDIDVCCKVHDNCPNFVGQEAHYQQYPGLQIRPQFFSRWVTAIHSPMKNFNSSTLSARLQCKCDAEFYQCLHNLNSQYASSIAVGYGFFQRYCFEFEYPIVECIKYFTWVTNSIKKMLLVMTLFPFSAYGMARCELYQVDDQSDRIWQWFDVLPSYLNTTKFPQIVVKQTNQDSVEKPSRRK